MSVRAVGIAGITVLVGACAGGDRPKQVLNDGQPLAPNETVRLEETDSTFVGMPTHMTAGADGSLFISDAMNSVVLQFGRDGSFVRRFGRRGAGPGEFGSPAVSAVMGDSLLVVADFAENRTTALSLATGEYIRSAPHEGYPFSMTIHDDTAWIGLVHATRSTSLAKWGLNSEGMDYFGALPSEYEASSQLTLSIPYATAILFNDTILYGVPGHAGLFLARRDGTVFDTVTVPAVRRRGVPADLVQRFTRDVDDAALAAIVSWLVGLHRLSDGRLAVVHQDLTFEGGERSSVSYLSIISPDRSSACPDILLQHGRDTRPMVAFSGDTLVTLETRLSEGDQAHNFVTSYDLGAIECEAVPIR